MSYYVTGASLPNCQTIPTRKNVSNAVHLGLLLLREARDAGRGLQRSYGTYRLD